LNENILVPYLSTIEALESWTSRTVTVNYLNRYKIEAFFMLFRGKKIEKNYF